MLHQPAHLDPHREVVRRQQQARQRRLQSGPQAAAEHRLHRRNRRSAGSEEKWRARGKRHGQGRVSGSTCCHL